MRAIIFLVSYDSFFVLSVPFYSILFIFHERSTFSYNFSYFENAPLSLL